MTLVNLAQLLHMFPLFHMPQRTRSLFHDKHRSDVAEIKKYQHMIVFPIFPNIFSRFSQYLPNLFPNLFPKVFPTFSQGASICSDEYLRCTEWYHPTRC